MQELGININELSPQSKDLFWNKINSNFDVNNMRPGSEHTTYHEVRIVNYDDVVKYDVKPITQSRVVSSNQHLLHIMMGMALMPIKNLVLL
ncbi:hypothetical protein [Paenibacillus ihumii]|uniref:hypothetical protein n=1 Tax=Paenibacillus ihumii TaxID=687436 RepID=UPI001CA33601|nr:hypothetical protein [Paenibacillus ihumii]